MEVAEDYGQRQEFEVRRISAEVRDELDNLREEDPRAEQQKAIRPVCGGFGGLADSEEHQEFDQERWRLKLADVDGISAPPVS